MSELREYTPRPTAAWTKVRGEHLQPNRSGNPDMATTTAPQPIRYYDFRRHWTKRIVPHLADPKLNEILVRDFNKFTWGRWRKRFKPGDLPAHFESCDWWLNHHPPHPRYWAYVKHAACHWLANFALRLATLAEPQHPGVS